MRKLVLVLFVTFFISGSIFSEAFGLELIKNNDFSVDVPLGVNCGELWNYSKGHTGVEIKAATTLFEENSKNYSVGMCSTFFFNYYLFNREEIQDFYIRGFTEGIWCDFALENDLILRCEVYGGFAVTKIKAESIYENKINNNYNCLAFGTDATLRKKIFKAGPADIYGNCGLNLKFLAEDSSVNSNITLIAGLTFKAAKK